MTDTLVNGPPAPFGTTNPLPPTPSTELAVSSRKPPDNPDMTSVIAKTSMAPTVAMANWRARIRRSAMVSTHMAGTPLEPSGVDLARAALRGRCADLWRLPHRDADRPLNYPRRRGRSGGGREEPRRDVDVRRGRSRPRQDARRPRRARATGR